MSLERIVERLRQWGRPWTAGREPVEIHRALLEEIAAQAIAVGGGRRIFPFARVEVQLLAATPEERVRLQAVVRSGWDLERDVRERLAGQGVEIPAGLVISVAVSAERAPEPGGRCYALAFGEAPGDAAPPTSPEALASPGGAAVAMTSSAASGTPPAAGAAGPLRPPLRLAVVKGRASRERYDFDAERIYLGRLEEVLDAAGRVRRRNDVAFLEEGELNQTVSREHARIAWDDEDRAFWLRDEGSASGTLVFRAGRSIEVSRHDRRGVRLLSGDEIYLGRASVKVAIGPGEGEGGSGGAGGEGA